MWIITINISAATLPTTVNYIRRLSIDRNNGYYCFPLIAVRTMCGTVSFATWLILSLFGVEVTPTTYIIMIVASLLINMSAPGIPNGGVVIGATYLQLLGIPLDFIGFYSGIYKILDMLYTTLNVSGDITANVIIDYLEKKEK